MFHKLAKVSAVSWKSHQWRTNAYYQPTDDMDVQKLWAKSSQ